MGAWGSNSFENDDACDWSGGLVECHDLSLVEEAFQTVLEVGDEYLEASHAQEAIAAAEVLARLRGNWGPRSAYTEDMDAWVTAHPQSVSQTLLARGTSVLDRILAPGSELADLWEDSDCFAEWKAAVADLRRRVVS